jgi:hypothetical protein
MNSNVSLSVCTALTLALSLVPPLETELAAAPPERRLSEIPTPDAKLALTAWTPVQQWIVLSAGGSYPLGDYGYKSLGGVVVFVDELGDKLSELGRVGFVGICLDGYGLKGGWAALRWATCGRDVAAIDLKKVEAELVAEHISREDREEVLKAATAKLETARRVGAEVAAAAASDPGLAAVLKLGETAPAEWDAFASEHREAIDRHLKLMDGVRTRKSNDPVFADCYEPTKVAFTKAIKGIKFPTESATDTAMPFYVGIAESTTEGYLATVAYAACAWSQHASGRAIYQAATEIPPGTARIGPRSFTVAKAFDPAFNPRIADRNSMIGNLRYQFDGTIDLGISMAAAIATPSIGKVATVKSDGDVTKITFSAFKDQTCAEYRDTKKIVQIGATGKIYYEQACVHVETVSRQAGDIEVATKYLGGIAVGTRVVAVSDFPVVVVSGKKVTGVLGVSLK